MNDNKSLLERLVKCAPSEWGAKLQMPYGDDTVEVIFTDTLDCNILDLNEPISSGSAIMAMLGECSHIAGESHGQVVASRKGLVTASESDKLAFSVSMKSYKNLRKQWRTLTVERIVTQFCIIREFYLAWQESQNV